MSEYAYIQFIKSCTNEIKHRNNKIVPVQEIANFYKYMLNKTREFRVKCGQGWCLATIGLTENKYECMFKIVLQIFYLIFFENLFK